MDTKRIVIGSLVGGVAMYALGYLIFERAFGPFYAANAGSATGVPRAVNVQWAVALGTLALAVLLTLAIESRGAGSSRGQAFLTAGVVEFLVWFGADFSLYGITNIANLTQTIVDPL